MAATAERSPSNPGQWLLGDHSRPRPVNIQGRAALVYFVSPTQLNVLAPDNTLTNVRFGIMVRNNGVNSKQFIASILPRNPEFFRFDGRYIAADHSDGTLVGKVDLFPDKRASLAHPAPVCAR